MSQLGNFNVFQNSRTNFFPSFIILFRPQIKKIHAQNQTSFNSLRPEAETFQIYTLKFNFELKFLIDIHETNFIGRSIGFFLVILHI